MLVLYAELWAQRKVNKWGEPYNHPGFFPKLCVRRGEPKQTWKNCWVEDLEMRVWEGWGSWEIWRQSMGEKGALWEKGSRNLPLNLMLNIKPHMLPVGVHQLVNSIPVEIPNLGYSVQTAQLWYSMAVRTVGLQSSMAARWPWGQAPLHLDSSARLWSGLSCPVLSCSALLCLFFSTLVWRNIFGVSSSVFQL